MTQAKQAVDCECGEWLGEGCQWSGPVKETVIVEFMPEHLRSSHEAAGNRGQYPGNGAVRVRVSKSCAKHMLEHDPDWVSTVSGTIQTKR